MNYGDKSPILVNRLIDLSFFRRGVRRSPQQVKKSTITDPSPAQIFIGAHARELPHLVSEKIRHARSGGWCCRDCGSSARRSCTESGLAARITPVPQTGAAFRRQDRRLLWSEVLCLKTCVLCTPVAIPAAQDQITSCVMLDVAAQIWQKRGTCRAPAGAPFSCEGSVP